MLEAPAVSNGRFAEFVKPTRYVTDSERVGWFAVFEGQGKRFELLRRRGSPLPWWHKEHGVW